MRAFDIHCGGMDLVFPHHENEIAQAKCAGDDFARYWLHNGWVTMGGEKMSKSLGNVLSVPNVLEEGSPARTAVLPRQCALPFDARVLRRQRSKRAPAAYRGLESFVPAHARACGRRPSSVRGPTVSRQALDDDLAVPERVGRDPRQASEGNTALDAGDLDEAVRDRAGQVRAMLAILGVDPLDAHWTQSGGDTEAAMEALDVLVRADLDRRQQARSRQELGGRRRGPRPADQRRVSK